MALITLSRIGVFINIAYPIGNTDSIYVVTIKKLHKGVGSDYVIIVTARDNTIALNYLQTEDPYNPGNPFDNVDALWDWLINNSGSSTLDLVAEYNLCGNVDDTSGKGNDGIAYGGTLINDRFTVPLSAYYLSDVDRIEFGDIPSLNSVQQFSISMWVFDDQWSKRLTAFETETQNVRLIWRGDTDSYASVVNGGSASYVQFNAGAITNSWKHFVMVFDGTLPEIDRISLFVDSVEVVTSLVGSPASTTSATCFNNVRLNQISNSNDTNVKGTYDTIKFFKNALNEAEVLNLFNEPARCGTGVTHEGIIVTHNGEIVTFT